MIPWDTEGLWVVLWYFSDAKLIQLTSDYCATFNIGVLVPVSEPVLHLTLQVFMITIIAIY